MSLKTGRKIGAVDSTDSMVDYRRRAGSDSVEVTVTNTDFNGDSEDISQGELVCVEGMIGFAAKDVSVDAENTSETLILHTGRDLWELGEDQLDTKGTYTRGKPVFAEVTSGEAEVTVTSDVNGNRFIGVADQESDDVLWFWLEAFAGIGIKSVDEYGE